MHHAILKKITPVILALVFPVGLAAQQMQHRTFRHGGFDREYYLYVPDSLNAGRPLVFMLRRKRPSAL